MQARTSAGNSAAFLAVIWLSLFSTCDAASPRDIDPEFECGWRKLAFEYGQVLQPERGAFQSLFDALELGTLCNVSLADVSRFGVGPADPPKVGLPKAAAYYYVDYTSGSDSNPGTESSPFKTISRAVNASRAGASRPAAILLAAGTHYLPYGTVQLGPEDSGLTIQAQPGTAAGDVVISGAQKLTVTWKPFNVTPASGTPMLVAQSSNAVYGETPNPDGPVVNFTKVPSAQDCEQLCLNHTRCNEWTWHAPVWGPTYDYTCWFRYDTPAWPGTPQTGHVSGCRTDRGIVGCTTQYMNVYVADLSGQNLDGFNMQGLQFVDSAVGARSRGIRARYPNSDPELIPTYLSSGASWWTPPFDESAAVIHVGNLTGNYAGMFQDYRLGVGGPCERYEVDPTSYWCQPDGRTAGGTYYVRSPPGMTVAPGVLPNAPYASKAPDAVVSAWRGDGEWFTWYWEVDAYDAGSGNFTFGRGGFQGAEGSDSGGRWFVENVIEELDYPREFFYDQAAQLLYFFMNASDPTHPAPPPQTLSFEAPSLEVLFDVRGSQEFSAVGISFVGLTLTATAATYLAPHGVPSGGDWALERLAAIVLEGTEEVEITGCTFTRLDGNAVVLNGYNRNATVSGNEFVWLGANGVAAWGYTDDWDGTGGQQPRFVTMSGNLCHEIGHYEKQSSCWFQAKSCQNNITRNVFFNGPRAMINFNDGFGGGSTISECLVFNSCRESSDHGPFNSWDRQPYVTLVRDGITPTVIPAFNEIHHNFMVANYEANGGTLDNDDGSSFYEDHHNFFIYGGHKSDFDGHSKRSYWNYHLYSQVYGDRCMGLMSLPTAADGLWNEGFYNCTCVLTSAGDDYFTIGGCSSSTPRDQFTVNMGGNTIYAPQAQVSIGCSGVSSFDQWLSMGFDNGTRVLDSATLSVPTMMQWGRNLLF
eukprot:TRINITY_DN7582_c0_g1_i1.p1 TRINITY_DN7582_c0_g1~~TRINITY_DN7582_c0_g1_i1.p1  ORF type:complete len:924 (-),score=219.53 TRINITY_DN7582_c0_g1_i1:171-2942(-)